jgi:hypothetical protein
MDQWKSRNGKTIMKQYDKPKTLWEEDNGSKMLEKK